jgi:NAD(P)-dependent dehydrogenase (short-subunit alcohol dehydrogenase family)
MIDLKLNGKVALVTGAGHGIGRGIAEVFAANGCDVIVNALHIEGAKETAAIVESKGRKALALQADVTKMAEVKTMVETAVKKFGRIDILVNNAGRATAQMPFQDTPEKNWEVVFNLNIYGVFNVTKVVLPYMLKQKWGRIVNISSGAGITGLPGVIHYSVSKAGIIAFTRELAKEVISQGINVNCVAPGLTDTNFLATAGMASEEAVKAIEYIPTKKLTTPIEIGEMVAFVVSEKGDNLVGQTILMNGGMP